MDWPWILGVSCVVLVGCLLLGLAFGFVWYSNYSGRGPRA